MAKPQQPKPDRTLSTFIKKFKKEFKRKPTDTEKWSFYEGVVTAYDAILKIKNKKY